MKINVEFTERDIERGQLIADAFGEHIAEKVSNEVRETKGNFGTFKAEGLTFELNLSEMFMEDATYLIIRVANGFKNLLDLIKPAFKNFCEKYRMPSKESGIDKDMLEIGNAVKVSLKKPVIREGADVEARLHYFTNLHSALVFIKGEIKRGEVDNIKQVYDLEIGENITSISLKLATDLLNKENESMMNNQ